MSINNSDSTKPEILKSLRLYGFKPGDVVEVRALDYKRGNSQGAILSGYYDDMEKLADDVGKNYGLAAGFYFTLNEINPALLYRRKNKYETGRSIVTTSDKDVVRRRWLPIDVDPERPTGISSTDEEHERALAKARDVRSWLTDELGWPAPLLVDSGNGAQLAYRIDLPAVSNLVEKCLRAVDLVKSDEFCHIDTSVINPARIWKLPGTMACKGEDSTERPHRQARILEAPEVAEVVPVEKLQALANLLDAFEPKEKGGQKAGAGLKVDSDKLLSAIGCRKLSSNRKGNGTISKLDVCPWDRSHVRSAFIVEYDDGGATIGCPHNSCGGSKNRILELLEQHPECRIKTTSTTPTSGSPSGELPTGREYHLSDAGNAERLVDKYGSTIRYCPQWGCWLIYDGQRWKRDETGQISTLAKKTIRDAFQEALCIDDEDKQKRVKRHLLDSEDHHKIKAMVASAQSIQEIVVEQDRLDSDRMLLNILNGTVDLRTGDLRDHDPRDLITLLAPVEYRKGEDCPKFKGFLSQIFPGDAELIRFVQAAKGYSITGMTGERCLFIEWGEGANGKSTLNNTITKIIGDYHRATQAETLFSKKNQDGIRNDLARLKGARYVTTAESGQGHSFDEALVKQVTGGDAITARFLHKEYFEFTPQFKIWLSTNHKPIIKGTDSAIWSRIRLIPFVVKIDPRDRIPDLFEKLYNEEASGILNWLIEGCLQWQKARLPAAKAVQEATDDYRQDMDILGAFVDGVVERCGDECLVSVKDLYGKYEAWCSKNGEQPIKQRTFVYRMKEKGFRTDKGGHNVTYWLGIRVKPEDSQKGEDNSRVDDNSKKSPSSAGEVIKLSSVTSNPVISNKDTYREKTGKSVTDDNSQAKTTLQHAELSSQNTGVVELSSQSERIEKLLEYVATESKDNVTRGYVKGAIEKNVIDYMMTFGTTREGAQTLIEDLLNHNVLMRHPTFPAYLTNVQGVA